MAFQVRCSFIPLRAVTPKLLLNAYVHDGITITGDEQHLVGLLNRMRLFAPPNVINEAEAVIRGLIEISLMCLRPHCGQRVRTVYLASDFASSGRASDDLMFILE